jgi:hypothetical protein
MQTKTEQNKTNPVQWGSSSGLSECQCRADEIEVEAKGERCSIVERGFIEGNRTFREEKDASLHGCCSVFRVHGAEGAGSRSEKEKGATGNCLL